MRYTAYLFMLIGTPVTLFTAFLWGIAGMGNIETKATIIGAFGIPSLLLPFGLIILLLEKLKSKLTH